MIIPSPRLLRSNVIPGAGGGGALHTAVNLSNNTLGNVLYGTPASDGGQDTAACNVNYLQAWCSAVYVAADNSMVVCNGGDGDYWGNEVYRFSFTTGFWSRVSSRSEGLTGVGQGAPGWDNSGWGEHVSPDGNPTPQPGVPHSYDQMEYLPPSLGGGTNGAFMFCSRTQVYAQGRYYHPHFYKMSEGTWHRGSTTQNICNMGSGTDAPSWAFDPTRNLYRGVVGGSGALNSDKLFRMNFNGSGIATGDYESHSSFVTPGGLPTSIVWPTGDAFLMMGRNEGGAYQFKIMRKDLGNEGGGFTEQTLTGDNVPGGGAGYGVAYCSDNDAIYIRMADGYANKLWKIQPHVSNPWPVTEITIANTPANYAGLGLWKRFMYVPSIQSVAWIDYAYGPVYGVRVIPE